MGGGRFPVSAFIDGGAKDGAALESGAHVVMFYHFDCEHCQAAMPDFLALCRELEEKGVAEGALLGVPPDGPAPEEAAASGVDCLRLTAEKEWMVETPTIVLVSEGRVVRVWARVVPAGAEVEAAMGAGGKAAGGEGGGDPLRRLAAE